jgi:hypothetical protein
LGFGLEAWNLEFGLWGLRLGSWKLEFGLWGLRLGSWNLEFGIWALGIEAWFLEIGIWDLEFHLYPSTFQQIFIFVNRFNPYRIGNPPHHIIFPAVHLFDLQTAFL